MKTPNGKDIQVGGGVQIRVEGTLYRVTAEVLGVDESLQAVEVRGKDFEGTVHLSQITDAMDPSVFAYDNAINVLAKEVAT